MVAYINLIMFEIVSVLFQTEEELKLQLYIFCAKCHTDFICKIIIIQNKEKILSISVYFILIVKNLKYLETVSFYRIEYTY